MIDLHVNAPLKRYFRGLFGSKRDVGAILPSHDKTISVNASELHAKVPHRLVKIKQ